MNGTASTAVRTATRVKAATAIAAASRAIGRRAYRVAARVATPASVVRAPIHCNRLRRSRKKK